MQMVTGLAVFFSILVPGKVWFAPTQPLMISNKSDAAITLVLTDFAGKPIEPAAPNEAAPKAAADIAPNTCSSILSLAENGFYDGLAFHRIVPGFVIQGGDPHGDGVGGPGYSIDAEFSNVKHEEGILSMARNGDPLERQGMKPRCEYANSAGSQFFV